MTTAVARTNGNGADIMEQVIIRGDLSKLSPPERANYYAAVCRSVGLNPLTKPFEYITLNGKLTLYALRNCTDQLRAIHKISVVDMSETERDGVCIVTCKVQNAEGRTDVSKGAVNIASLKGEALANAIMKCETKAKRRATLSICGLSLLDETEVEDIPAKQAIPIASDRDPVAPDDPDYLPAADGIEARVVDQRKDYEALQKEMRAITDPVELQKWGATVAKERMGSYRKSWQNDFRRDYTDYLQALRKPPEPEADWLDTINDAYSKCETAADAFEVDKKLFLPFIGSVSPDDRDRAQALRTEHLNRIEGTPQ